MQQLLSEKGRRSCSYDRPGYGRSDTGSNDATPQENAQRTYNLLTSAGEQGPYVLVGWSAGV
jgi:thioesterase domain-containing protein